MLRVKLPVVDDDGIQPQRNKYAMGVDNKVTVDSNLYESPVVDRKSQT